MLSIRDPHRNLSTGLACAVGLSCLLFAQSAAAAPAIEAEPAPAAGSPGHGRVAPVPATRVYRYASESGTVSFSDRPPARGAFVTLTYGCFACDPDSHIDWNLTHLYPDAYASEIEQAARSYHVDPSLVRAVIHAESGFNANARSPRGAIGLMQLMPGTARLMGISNPTLPLDNIRGGVRYLAEMLTRFHSDITLATAAYNAGPEAVQRHSGVPPFRETQVYVQRVRVLHLRYIRARG